MEQIVVFMFIISLLAQEYEELGPTTGDTSVSGVTWCVMLFFAANTIPVFHICIDTISVMSL